MKSFRCSVALALGLSLPGAALAQQAQQPVSALQDIGPDGNAASVSLKHFFADVDRLAAELTAAKREIAALKAEKAKPAPPAAPAPAPATAPAAPAAPATTAEPAK